MVVNSPMKVKDYVLEKNNLVYSSGSEPGISRKRIEGGFIYLDKNGYVIKNEKLLSRIKKLVLPPAWENVWIAEQANAHLQAIGTDQAGRKQYRYHPDWCNSRNENKYYRLHEFGSKLPEIRRNLQRDIRRKRLDERKVLAISVSLMQKTLIRIGNKSYKELYGTYGLSTLRDRHVKIDGSKLKVSFKGKKGVMHDIELIDRSLAKLVKSCRDIPGQELFQYYDEAGERRSIDSGKINNYIREITSCDFTAKDFRTWSGSLEAVRSYFESDWTSSESERKKISNTVLDQVAEKLGNTRSVCKKYYIFPALIEAFENGGLIPYLNRIKKANHKGSISGLDADEKVLLSFLAAERRKNSGQI